MEEPRYSLDLRTADTEAMRAAIAAPSRRSGPTGCWSTATPTRPSRARSRPWTPACRSRTSRRACAAATSMPEERNRIETDRLAQLLLLRRRSRGASRRGRSRPGRGRRRRHGGRRPAHRVAPGRSRARGARVGPAATSCSRSTARRTRARSASGGSSRASTGSRSRSSSRCTAHARRARPGGARARAPRRRPAAARLPRPDRARLAGARDPHRLGRAPEGGLLARRALRDAAPSTEWVDTVEAGANVLVDDDPDRLVKAVAEARMPLRADSCTATARGDKAGSALYPYRPPDRKGLMARIRQPG